MAGKKLDIAPTNDRVTNVTACLPMPGRATREDKNVAVNAIRGEIACRRSAYPTIPYQESEKHWTGKINKQGNYNAEAAASDGSTAQRLVS